MSLVHLSTSTILLASFEIVRGLVLYYREMKYDPAQIDYSQSASAFKAI